MRILMIEDDFRLATMVRAYLSDAGHEVAVADDGARALVHLERQPYELVLLDLMLPDVDGLTLCARIRQISTAPIIMVTARGDVSDRIVGLEMGADDYLPKPFEPRELLARIRAVMRRGAAGTTSPGPARPLLRFGRLEIEPDARAVRVDGEERTLTARQFDILLALARSAGRVLSREALIDQVLADASDSFDRSIDVHVARIRAAIEDDPKHPRRVITVRGAGYLFAASQP
ncbi:MAG: response regulator transcription factor [Burkholderiaceae bacterium]|nr:response regulator transcription factor [Burkholderiaceae bacterium]